MQPGGPWIETKLSYPFFLPFCSLLGYHPLAVAAIEVWAKAEYITGTRGLRFDCVHGQLAIYSRPQEFKDHMHSGQKRRNFIKQD